MKKILTIAISVALSFGFSVSCFATEEEDLMLIQTNEGVVASPIDEVDAGINVENLDILEQEEILEEEENIEEEEEAGESFWNEITITTFLAVVVVVILALNIAQKRK